MESYVVIATGFLILVTCLLRYISTKRGSSGKTPPGPKGIPVIGCALQVKPKHIHEQMYSFAETYGDLFVLEIFGIHMLVLNSSELITKAFSTENIVLNDRAPLFVTDIIKIGDATSFRKPDKGHRYLRKHFTKGLNMSVGGTSVCETVMKQEVHRVMDQIEGFGEQEFEVVGLMRRSLINMMSILLIGEEATDEVVADFDSFVKVEYFFDAFTNVLLTAIPVLQHVPFLKRKLQHVVNMRDRLGKKFFYDVKDSWKPGEEAKCLIDYLLSVQDDKDNSVLTDNAVQSIAIADVLSAGVSATSMALPCIIKCLALHPEYQTRLQAEIDGVIGVSREPSYSDRNQCPFVEAVVMETLRLITPVPLLLPHYCSEDTVFEGYEIKAKTQIFGNVWFIHHDERIWGDPWTFRPERFLDGDGNLLPQTHEYMKSFLPFGSGRRKCPGSNLAMTRMFLYVSCLLQKWSFIPAPGRCTSCDPRSEEFHFELLLTPNPFYCIPKRRN